MTSKHDTISDHMEAIASIPLQPTSLFLKSVRKQLSDLYDDAQRDYREAVVARLFDIE